MQELKVIGVESGALLAASEEGDRFRIPIDEVLQSRLRQAQADPASGPKLSPKEVQAHIRAGMSAEDVAAVTGASIDFVRRFEGPVVAERDYMVSCALSVPVHTAIDPDPIEGGANFGTVIRERLASLGATNERWASWKEPGAGWIVKLAFTADDIDHDARWGFEPKKNSLSPVGNEAIALSQQGELKGALIPRLRAVGAETSLADVSRFDSGAFTFKESLAEEMLNDTAPLLDPVPYSRSAGTTDAVSRAAIKRADEPPQSLSETADLLASLRRRRGEREAAAFESNQAESHHSGLNNSSTTGTAHSGTDAAIPAPGIRLVDQPVEPAAEPPAAPVAPAAAASTEVPRNAWSAQAAAGQASAATPRASGHGKRGRASMPSWDEIVFGART
ncbi:MAG TPA: septation protein SepH, partial [Cryobacterium sp.]|nr:septation protein SepH [Cryobacterium sp.]